jgi:hypothetical protein
MVLKKRSIDGYVSIFQNHFRSRCAKYGFSVNVVNSCMNHFIWLCLRPQRKRCVAPKKLSVILPKFSTLFLKEEFDSESKKTSES